ncbi:hypothetical protein PG993_006282 [Apiospora rasikravindrae]|uniref:Uncharacterized protein n=1 Tax=Apiospora rasikravindrae TaxID=990691 RepID=A0ABR1T590_9PEZI
MSWGEHGFAFDQLGFGLGYCSPIRDEATTERICVAIAGPDTTLMKTAVFKAIEWLFDTLKEHSDLFRVLGDTELFWGLIAVNWDIVLHAELSPSDLKPIADTYITGRRAAVGGIKQSKSERDNDGFRTFLEDAVDDWIEIIDDLQALGQQPSNNAPLHQLFLTAAARQQHLNNIDISKNPRVSFLQQLNAQECAWLLDSHVAQPLLDHAKSFPFEGKIMQSDIPAIPNCFSYPQDIKRFLCWASLARFDPAEFTFAVFMAPIAFMDKRDRKDNYVTTGSLSKRMATIGEFFDYALEMLNNQGREMVIGMMTYCRCRETRAPGYQVLLYDPEHATLKTQPRNPRTTDRERDERIKNMHMWREEIELVADEKLGHMDFAEMWGGGGKKPSLLQNEYDIATTGDSVSQVAAWTFDAVSGRFPTPQADVVELVDEWGYERFNTLHMEEEETGGEVEEDDNDEGIEDKEDGEEGWVLV